MGDMFSGIETVKKQLVLFFLVDTSGSMEGVKIGAVNTACREALTDPAIKDAGGADADIVVAVLEFSNGCKWQTALPVPINAAEWRDLYADGGTDLGAACIELSKKLDKNQFLKAKGGSAAPVIILMSDGEPTDDFKRGVAVLKQNKYYSQCIRLACAIGQDANVGVLADFTGSTESVLRVHTPEVLKKWIRLVTLTGSKVGSKSQPASGGVVASAQDTAVKTVVDLTKRDAAFIEDSTKGDNWNL